MTNKLKCPVCGEVMIKEFYAPYSSYACKNPLCPIDTPHVDSIEYGNTLIQSRIDKEKAAAVQEERGRVKLKVLNICYAIEKCGASKELTNATTLASELIMELQELQNDN